MIRRRSPVAAGARAEASPTRSPAPTWASLAVLAALLLLAVISGCKSKDARTKLLEERARWSVSLQSWVENTDGGFTLDTRVEGPPNSTLKQLSVRFDFVDDAESSLEHYWHTYDLTKVERGGPRDFLIRVPLSGVEGVAGVTAPQLILDPGPEDEPHIKELEGL